MKVEAGDLSAINLSVQQVLSLWAHGTVLRSLTDVLLFCAEKKGESEGETSSENWKEIYSIP